MVTRNKYYGNPNPLTRKDIHRPSTFTPPTFGPFQIVKLAPELTIKPPKGVITKSSSNPHMRDAQNYNIV